MSNELDKILIEVYGGTKQNCESSCSGCGFHGNNGDMAPLEELIDNAAEELHKTFGESVKIKYIDTDIAGLDDFAICRQVLEAGHSFPITVINGQPRIASGFNFDLIKQILNEIAFQLINEINKGREQSENR